MEEKPDQAGTETAKPIPISEPSKDHQKIPKVIFIDNADAWVEKYGEDPLFAQMNELYQKYKFMEQQLLRSRQNLRVKLPDIKKTLEMVVMLKKKHEAEDKSVETNFLVSDNIWAKAKVPNTTGKVGLWLGANVMVEYGYDDALKLLAKNLASAEERLAEHDDDIDYLKDQITTSEVNIARIYNQGLQNKQAKDKEEKKAQ